jgi:hypothetical protein
MFSHSPGALHPFCRQRSVALDREFASRLDDDLDAGWNWQEMGSFLRLQFLMILLIFQLVRTETKTKYFRKAESTI